MPAPKLPTTRAERTKGILASLSMLSGAHRTKAEAKLLSLDPARFDRFESLVEQLAEYEGGPESYKYTMREIIKERDPDKFDSLLNTATALGVDRIEDVLDVRLMHGMRSIPEFAEHMADLTQAPDEVVDRVHALGAFITALQQHDNVNAVRNGTTRVRLVDRELEKLLAGTPGADQDFLDWADTITTMERSDSTIIKRVIRHPEDRAAIKALMNEGTLRSDLIEMILERPGDKSAILNLLNEGVERIAAIRAVLDGDSPRVLSSGAL